MVGVTSRDVDAGIGAWSACSSYRYIYIGHPYSLLPIHYHPLPCTTPPLLESPTYTLLGKVGYPPVGGGCTVGIESRVEWLPGIGVNSEGHPVGLSLSRGSPYTLVVSKGRGGTLKGRWYSRVGEYRG